MSWLFAPLYDSFMSGLERRYGQAWRREVLSGLGGRVLEIGAGTGANLEHYPDEVEQVVLAEPDAGMRGRLERKLPASRLGSRGVVSSLPVEGIGDGLGRFDAVVATLVFCTVPSPERAIEAAFERLRPGGRLVFVEHVASDEPSTRRWQSRLTGVWRALAGGCTLDRETVASIERGGFELEWTEREVLPRAPSVLATIVRGSAIRP